MGEPRPAGYPYEKKLTRLALFFLFPEPGETKRQFMIARHLRFIITLGPPGTTYELVKTASEDADHVHLTPFDVRALKQILEGGNDKRFHRVEYEPSKWGRFFGGRAETKIVISDDVYVLKREDGRELVLHGPAQRVWRPWANGSGNITMDQDEVASLVSVLSAIEI